MSAEEGLGKENALFLLDHPPTKIEVAPYSLFSCPSSYYLTRTKSEAPSENEYPYHNPFCDGYC